MSLSNDRRHWKLHSEKPRFWCIHGMKKHAMYAPIDPSTVVRCEDKQCFCKRIDGWLGYCDLCGAILHSCPWGCRFPISTKVSAHHTFSLEYHYIMYHSGAPQLMEYPINREESGFS